MTLPLVAWAGFTVAAQFNIGRNLLRKIDPTGLLIPDWRFFAPHPAEHEYRLLYRDMGGDEALTSWQEIDLSMRRSALHLVWAPHRRLEKALFDATSELLSVTESTDDLNIIKLSTSYLALLNVVTYQSQREAGTDRVQFLIMRAAEYEASVIPDPVFLSDFHRLRENV